MSETFSAFDPDAGHRPQGGRPDGRSDAPDPLPPVEPPSAGLIVQLFVIPALIVGALVGGWALFNRMVAGEKDITRVLADVRSPNANRRGPAMLTLTNMLRVDSTRDPQDQKYVRDRSVAAVVAETFDRWLETDPLSQEEKVDVLNTQVFLVRALGLLDVPDVVLPALREALYVQPEPASGDSTEQEIRSLQQQVRHSAVESIAIVADRAAARGDEIDDPGLVAELIAVTSGPDAEVQLQHRGAFVLGLLPGEQSRQQLRIWLKNADPKTRLNAAISLARQDSTDGLDVFQEVLEEAGDPLPAPASRATLTDQQRREQNRERFDRWVAVRNVLEAIRRLHDRLGDRQRAELIRLIEPIARDFHTVEVRDSAESVLTLLKD